MKKCPYCYSELDERASICFSCRKKVGKKGRNGIAKKYTSPVTKLILFIFIAGIVPLMLLPFFGQDKQESSKSETFTLAEKKKICDHTTIADDISGLIGRSLEEGRALVAKHFNITMEQFTQINVEGLEKVWSMPPKSARNDLEYEYLWRTKNDVKIKKSFEEYIQKYFNSYEINKRERIALLGGGWVKEKYTPQKKYNTAIQKTNVADSPFVGICEFKLLRNYTEFHSTKKGAKNDNNFVKTDAKVHQHKYEFRNNKWIVASRLHYTPGDILGDEWYDCNEIIKEGKNKGSKNIFGCWEE